MDRVAVDYVVSKLQIWDSNSGPTPLQVTIQEVLNPQE